MCGGKRICSSAVEGFWFRFLNMCKIHQTCTEGILDIGAGGRNLIGLCLLCLHPRRIRVSWWLSQQLFQKHYLTVWKYRLLQYLHHSRRDHQQLIGEYFYYSDGIVCTGLGISHIWEYKKLHWNLRWHFDCPQDRTHKDLANLFQL